MARDGVLIDARAAERYRGEIEPVDPVAGHIPGAVNVPTAGNLSRADAGSPVRLDELAAALRRRRGVERRRPVGVYCGSGVTAAHDVLALQRLGRRGRALPRLVERVGHRPDRPVATGDQP